MKNKIELSNYYREVDVWNGNYVKKYEWLDLFQTLNSETPIISIQKTTIQAFEKILEDIWVMDSESDSLKWLFGRSWYLEIVSKQLWRLWLLLTKGSDSTLVFSQISDYYMWGTDIWDNIQARWMKLKELWKIAWEELWKYKTELLLIIWWNSLKRVLGKKGDLSNFELDMIATKFTPTLTQKAIKKLPVYMKKPGIVTVDSNSELAVQQLELLDRSNIVWWVEIVQSWASFWATQNALVRDNKLIRPSSRSLIDWWFYWEPLSEIDPESQVWRIANSIQTEIDVILYKILNDSNKPIEFIKAILEKMK